MIFSFENCEVNTETRELRCGGDVRPIEPRAFALLQYLIENNSRMVSKDEVFANVWDGRIVSDSALSSQIKALRRAIGDDGRSQNLIRTIHGQGFRFVGSLAPDKLKEDTQKAADQVIRYCKSSDNVRLAYATVGEGPALIKTANWLNHLEYDWQSPVWRHLLRELARHNTLVRYDERGTGLSDWNVLDMTLERCVDDLETIVEAVGHERFALFGVSQGAAIAVAYAVRHPERVSHLILYGGYVKGWRARNIPEEIERREAMITLMQHGWGADNPAFRQLFTSLFIPGGTPAQMAWFNDLQRISTSPEHAVHHSLSTADYDISSLLPHVSTPTLVMHCTDDAVIPFSAGQELAKSIPNANFKTLTGSNHLVLEHEPAWPVFISEIRKFLNA